MRVRAVHVWVTVALSGMASLVAMPVLAQTSEVPRSVSVSLRVGTEVRDLLSIADVRPVGRSTVVGEMDLGYEPHGMWRAEIGGRVGGSWLDFRQPLLASGNIKDQTWGVHAGLDRWIVRGSRASAYLGAFGEYGEARSWSDTRTYSQSGARTFSAGGGARIGFVNPIGGRCDLLGELGESVYRAHARNGATASDFNWIGRSFFLTVGIRVNIGKRPATIIRPQ